MGKKRNLKIIMLIFSCFFIIGIGISPLFNVNPPILNSEKNQDSIIDNSPDLLLSQNELDRVQWEDDQYANPGFETWTGNNAYYWGELLTQHRYQWFANSPWPVNEGSQSMGTEVRSYQQDSVAQGGWTQGGFTASLINLTLTFDWYLDSNSEPLVDRGQFYIRLQFDNSRWIEYYLNGTTSNTNSSTTVMYFLDEPSQTWNSFSRNVTEDYESASLFPAVDPLTNLTYIYILGYHRGYSDGYVRWFVDDFNLVNELSIGDVVSIGGSTRNGNFESSSNWNNYGNTDGSNAIPTTDVVSGSLAMNTTVFSEGNGSRTRIINYPRSRITSDNPGVLELNWKIDKFIKTGTDISSYVHFRLRNNTNQFNFYLYLAYADGYFVNNETSSYRLHVPQFNETGTWNFHNLSIWDTLSPYFHTDEIIVESIYLYTIANPAGSVLSVLFDDVSVKSSIINDRDYEDQYETGDEIRGWGTGINEYSFFTVTDLTHSGSKAANYSASGTSQSISQYLGITKLQPNNELYLDVWWNLQNFTFSVGSYANIRIRLSNGYLIYYYFGYDTLGSNTSYTVRFVVDGANTTNTWTQLKRNITQDYEAVFGPVPVDIFLERVYIEIHGGSGTYTEYLLDDFYFYIDLEPTIKNVTRTPTSPIYTQSVDVQADVLDSNLDIVLLHYRVDSGSWVNQTMSFQSGNTYQATIPSQVYDSEVEYFVSANDTTRKTSTKIDDNGSYFSYTVEDTIDPILSNNQQEPTLPTYIDSVNITIEATDAGSGVQQVVLYYRIDGGSFQQITMSLLTGDTFNATIDTQSWNTLVEYYFNATDSAENSVIDNNASNYYKYTVNDNANPSFTITTPTDGVTVNETITITINPNDDGSSVSHVEIYIDSSLVSNLTASPYEYIWNTTAVTNGSHEIRIVVYDGAGNQHEQTINVTVQNTIETTDTTDTTGGTPPPLPIITIFMVLGGVGAIILVIVIVFLQRKKIV
ncbi:MAG: Ig-like domain-containing protein [Candidatus Ranarchaeia archaeon]